MGFGSDIIPVMNFRVKEDFIIEYGETKEVLKVPRMMYKTGERVSVLISEVMSKDISATMQIIASGWAQKENKTDLPLLGDISKMIKPLIENLMKYKLFGMLEQLLIATSESKITKVMIEKMQFGEAAGILQYLLDKNYESLKNCTASLEAITSYTK